MPLHESVHSTVFKTKILNEYLAIICGFLTFRPPIYYKLYHFAHHRYTGDIKKDPELQNTILDPSLDSLAGYLLYLSSLPFWFDRFYTFIINHALLGRTLSHEFYVHNKEAKSEVIRFINSFLFLK